MDTTHPADAAARRAGAGTRFLEDWGPDHRTLLGDDRDHAGAYIRAICRRECPGDDGAAELRAITYWMVFRTAYDEARGAYQKGPHEDVARCLRRL
jgi:hypothetical protein